MRLVGWGVIIGTALAAFVYSPGFLWGMLPAGFPRLVRHILSRPTMHYTHTY